MKRNPIYRKDVLETDRSLLMPIAVFAVDLFLMLLVIINLYSVQTQASATFEIPYVGFVRFYKVLLLITWALILLFTPAVGVESVVREREAEMLSLLRASQLDERSFLLGKVFSASGTAAVVFLSTLPILATIFIYGGVTILEALLLVLYLLLTIVFCAVSGIAGAVFLKNATAAGALSYLFVFLFSGVFIFFWYFASVYGISRTLAWEGAALFMLLSSVLLFFVSCFRLAGRGRRRRG